MDVVALLGRNVRLQREARGLSQEELAFEAGMKRSYLSELERGLRNPSVRALGRLAMALDVEPAALLAGSEDAQVKCN
jgi:transcriptional regulator with XRE-family HTH domain